MARYRASIKTRWTPDEAFAYLSDFSTSAEWDPGVAEAERVGTGALAGLSDVLGRPVHATVDAAA